MSVLGVYHLHKELEMGWFVERRKVGGRGLWVVDRVLVVLDV